MKGSHRSPTAPRRLRLRLGSWAAGGAVLVGVAAALGPSIPAQGAAATTTAATGPVLSTPAKGTPELQATTTTEQVRQLVQCGNTMYAVGTFTEIRRYTTVYSRNNIFSFQATAPYSVTSWNPDVNGTVNSITFEPGNCADAYIGGNFSSVDGTGVKDLAEVDTTTGAVVTKFLHHATGVVNTLLGVSGHVLVGGFFKSVNYETTDPFMVSLNPLTGKDDGFLHLSISGNIEYKDVHTNTTEIYNQQLSPSGTLDLVEGDFTSVGGQPRQQIFMLNLATSPATVTGWSSPEFDGSQGLYTGTGSGGYPYQCNFNHPMYVQSATWSPDGQTIYLADTGYHPWNLPKTLPGGLCDMLAAFPATQAEVTAKWINYTGCNSLYSVAADNYAVYAGGHLRWAEAQAGGISPIDGTPSIGCKVQGSGIPSPGMLGVNPSTGNLMMNSSGTAGVYSRSRGFGADDMLLTTAGLWIASDNYQNSVSCGGVGGHAGICFLPY